MNITVLGKWGAYPEADAANSAFLLEKDGFHLLVDCGSGVLSQLQKQIPLDQLDAVILSHYHNDHIADIGVLQYAMLIHTQLGKRQRALPIYGHSQDEQKFATLTLDNFTVGKEIKVHQSVDIGPFAISFCETIHPVYCLAMRIETNDRTVVYSADTEWVPELVDFAKKADLLICEASLYNEQFGKVKGHMTAGEAGKLAAQANAKKLLLTHFPHYGDHDLLVQEAKEIYEGEVLLAESGLTV